MVLSMVAFIDLVADLAGVIMLFFDPEKLSGPGLVEIGGNEEKDRERLSSNLSRE